MPAPPENSNPQASPARHEVHWKVPMQPTFLTPSPAGHASPVLASFGQRVIPETASLRTLSAEPLLLPNPCPDPNSRQFPFPISSLLRFFLCYMHLSIYPLTLPQQRCRQPRASPQHSQLQSQHRLATHSFHHCPPSIMTASSGWSSGSCYSLVCAKCQASVSSLPCQGADMFSCLLPAHAEAP